MRSQAANIPTPWQTEILAPGSWAAANPHEWRSLNAGKLKIFWQKRTTLTCEFS
jgi:hypothetical protein